MTEQRTLPLIPTRLEALVRLYASANAWEREDNDFHARCRRDALENDLETLRQQGASRWPNYVMQTLDNLFHLLEMGGFNQEHRREATILAFAAYRDFEREQYSLAPAKEIKPSEIDAEVLTMLEAHGTPWFQHISLKKNEEKFLNARWRCYLRIFYASIQTGRVMVCCNDYPLAKRDFDMPRVDVLADIAKSIRAGLREDM